MIVVEQVKSEVNLEVNIFEGIEYLGSGPGADRFLARIGPRTVGIYGDLETAIANRTKAMSARAEASKRKKLEQRAKKMAGSITTSNESRTTVETS